MWWLLAMACTRVTPDDSGSGDDSGDTGETGVETVALTVVGFNVESGDSVASVVAQTVEKVEGESLWGFCEVEDGDAGDILTDAADDGGEDWGHLLGTTGFTDRLVLAWNRDRLELEEYDELHDINMDGDARSPLVATFRDLETDVRFLAMVNHLWRTDDDARHEQASRLHDWAEEQDLPVIAVGDYNFDWAVEDGDDDHDDGYDNMVEDDAWEWVRPDELIRTQCNATYNDVLDFTFAAGDAKDWDAEAEILEPSNLYCQDDEEKSDHRPVKATFEIPID